MSESSHGPKRTSIQCNILEVINTDNKFALYLSEKYKTNVLVWGKPVNSISEKEFIRINSAKRSEPRTFSFIKNCETKDQETEEIGFREGPIWRRTRSSQSNAPRKWTSIQHGVDVTSCR